MKVTILPSLLAADMGHLSDEITRAGQAGADELHLDIMDGHFVPNLSFGPDVVAMADRVTDMALSVHLMLSRPDRYIERFAEVGADSILIHVESDCNVGAELERIRKLGVVPGITINPETDAEHIFEHLPRVGVVLCMSVHPGYGGQSFIPDVIPKIEKIRGKAEMLGLSGLNIMVDGGINAENIVDCARSGANQFVAGTWLFRADNMAERVAFLRNNAEKAVKDWLQ